MTLWFFPSNHSFVTDLNNRIHITKDLNRVFFLLHQLYISQMKGGRSLPSAGSFPSIRT
ncbi:hypothetical protein CLOSTMETH_03130 [[Clostridium] methylpentosum DSM 5476]|uniref:Uncharacterized protein n=1 Tax=[Clostridium] methylpentosum DSM 5476 TaxID=537013 RepID=C0EGY6_9FIRM|nr:hypothetical protein CLOSTMETH_03130 [[Clostridium] methylpentosum DSM 5476]